MISDTDRADTMGDATREKLRQSIARIERLAAEKDELTADIAEVYSEAKSFGYDTKVLRKIIALRKMDPNDLANQEALMDVYMDALED